MNRNTALSCLFEWDRKGRYIYTLYDLSKLFLRDKHKTFKEGVNRLVKAGILKRVCRGIYVFAFAHSDDGYTIERIATTLRRGKYNYISLESALSDYGVISQISLDRLTVMTSGRKGLYHTQYGSIEFTHTKRSVSDILKGVVQHEHPLRIATKQTAWRDLKRVGRNTHLADQSMLTDD